MRALIGLLVAICLIPASAALNVQPTGPDRPLVPGEAWAGQATIEIQCRPMLQAGTGTTVTVLLSYDFPEHISFDGPAELVIEKTRCLPNQPSIQETINFALSGTHDLLALQAQEISIHAKLVDGSEEGSGLFTVLMDYVGGFEVSAPVLMKKAGPQKQISYQIEIRNLANGQTKIMFEVASHLKDDSKGQILVPDMLLLDAAGGAHDVAIATVTYSTPFENGSNYLEDAFEIRILGEYSFDSARKANNTEIVEFGAITEGMYVPGPGLILAPGLLLLAAFLRRRA